MTKNSNGYEVPNVTDVLGDFLLYWEVKYVPACRREERVPHCREAFRKYREYVQADMQLDPSIAAFRTLQILDAIERID
jgi:hypothetical protein